MILRQLEHHDRLSGNQLAAMVSSSRRTIITDMEDLRQFFSKSAEISAASNGYELKIKDLAAYQKRKEALLKDDPNLILLHLLCQQVEYLPEKIIEITGLSSQTLNKQIRSLEGILTHYKVTLDREKWQIVGPEANIRLFYYAFYFKEEQPYKIFEQLSSNLSFQTVSELKFDRRKAEQWVKVFLLRTKQGACLPEYPQMAGLCRNLLQKSDFQPLLINKPLPFTEQELAVLMMLSFDEEGLLSFLIKNEWVKSELSEDLNQIFNQVLGKDLEVIAPDQILLHFTLAILLLDRLFHVPINQPLPVVTSTKRRHGEISRSKMELSKTGYRYLADLTERYLIKQAQIKNQLLINYQMISPKKIKQWVIQELGAWLEIRGIRIVSEQKKDFSFFKVRQIIVSDHHLLYPEPFTPVYSIDRSLQKESIHQLGERILKDFQTENYQKDWIFSEYGFQVSSDKE